MTIIPIGDDEPFDINLVHEAAQLGRAHPELITDQHLRHYATYDMNGAQALRQKREQAQARRVVRPAPHPAPPPAQGSGLTKAGLEALIAGLAPPLKAEFVKRDQRITELERRIQTLTDEYAAMKDRLLVVEAGLAVTPRE